MLFLSSLLTFTFILLLGGCSGFFRLSPDFPSGAAFVKTDDYVIVIARPADTLHTLAQRFLGDAANDWMIADFNEIRQLTPGRELVIPLKAKNPIGIYVNGYQTIPILAYHRFGSQASKLVVTPTAFNAQMAYLKSHDYRVIPLTELHAFIRGHASLPRRAVVITIDDGFKSVYTIAYPILQKYGLPATLFVYSDFIGGSQGLNWQEIRDMAASNLIDIQPHSKSHTNLGFKKPSEDDAIYAQRVEREVQFPLQQIQRQLNRPVHTFAYPYGDTNDVVISQLQQQHYQMGATVEHGGNPFFADPFRLRRTLIYGDQSLEAFIKSLAVFRNEKLF
jgi:peptidoglycan/xylan/chitin deacetylase (PgdA/CDA1 family)